jgi:hypothetical protein
MPPRPATIAPPPSTASPASWNPAVAPPPVTGAPTGAGLGDALGEGEGLGLGDADGLALTLVLALADELVLAVVRGEEPPLALLVAVLVAVELTVELTPAEPVAEGMKVDAGGVEAGPEVQAESATQASMAVRPQPTAVGRTRCDVHAMAVRALIEPPGVLGNDHFPVAGRRNEENAGDLTLSPSGDTNRQWRAHHRNIKLCG